MLRIRGKAGNSVQRAISCEITKINSRRGCGVQFCQPLHEGFAQGTAFSGLTAPLLGPLLQGT